MDVRVWVVDETLGPHRSGSEGYTSDHEDCSFDPKMFFFNLSNVFNSKKVSLQPQARKNHVSASKSVFAPKRFIDLTSLFLASKRCFLSCKGFFQPQKVF